MPYDSKGDYIFKKQEDLTFDPKTKLIRTKGSPAANYLEVKWRMVMLRELFPEARHSTEVLWHDAANQIAMVKATIELPPAKVNLETGMVVVPGARGQGIKTESFADFKDYMEKAETGATGRALYATGVGAQFSGVEYAYEEESPKDYTGVDAGIVPDTKTKKPKLPPANQLRDRMAAVAKTLGVEAVRAESQRRFNTESSGRLSSEQLFELVTWGEGQSTQST